MAEKKSWVMYDSWIPLFTTLPHDSAANLILAICKYRTDRTYIPDDPMVLAPYAMITEQLEKDEQKYLKTCEIRAESGREGGKAKASKAKQRLANASKSCQELANLADKDKDKDKEKDNDIDKKSVARTQEQKHIYGEYKHVRLTDQEFSKLVNDYGEHETQEAISLFDEYIEEKGYKSKSHYLAMRRWVFKAVQERRQRQTARSGTQRSELDAWASA